MLTGFQQFLVACIAKTEEDTDQPDDAQHNDESQAELEIATDDNSVDDTEPIDTPAPDHTEAREDDVPPVTRGDDSNGRHTTYPCRQEY